MPKLTEHELQARQYWAGQLSELIGGEIAIVLIDPKTEDYDEMYGLIVLMPDKTRKQIWFLSDEEGNNAGRFQVSNLS